LKKYLKATSVAVRNIIRVRAIAAITVNTLVKYVVVCVSPIGPIVPLFLQ